MTDRPRYNPDFHRRRSIRLQGYDYSREGAYFVTTCTHNRECLFGGISAGQMVLNDAGHIARECWLEIPMHFPHVVLDEFIVMPNHIHGIVLVSDTVGAKNFSPLQSSPSQPITSNSSRNIHGTSRTIGSVVRGFKIGVTKWMRLNTQIYEVWQRNYYERIIRNEKELNQIREYIANNPANWLTDENNPVMP